MILIDYSLYFLATIIFSTLFAIIGLGSSIVLIPIFTVIGIDFIQAKAVGTFINGVTTITTTFNNIKRHQLNYHLVIPFIIISTLFAIFGAYSSNYISEIIVQILFIFFILVSIGLLFITNFGFLKEKYELKYYIYFLVAFIAFISGLLGLGGGAIYLPLLIYFGMKTKDTITTVSAMIPFISFSAFFTYSTFIEIDWQLISVVSVGAIIGGYFGNKIMHTITNHQYLRVFISIILFIVALQLSYISWVNIYG